MTIGGGLPICMRCGSGDIRHQSSGDGLWPAGGEGVAWVCDACGHIGAPFLLDRPARAGAGPAPMDGPGDAAWRREVAEAAFAVDDDGWRPPARRRWPVFGVLLVLLGLLFLAPGVLSLEAAISALHPWAVVRALVGTGWLSAIGVVLLVVGWRQMRPAAPPAAPAA